MFESQKPRSDPFVLLMLPFLETQGTEVLGARAGHRCVLVVGRVVSQSKSIITIQTKRYKNQKTTFLISEGEISTSPSDNEGDQERFPLFLRRMCKISTGRDGRSIPGSQKTMSMSIKAHSRKQFNL